MSMVPSQPPSTNMERISSSVGPGSQLENMKGAAKSSVKTSNKDVFFIVLGIWLLFKNYSESIFNLGAKVEKNLFTLGNRYFFVLFLHSI